jgi:hypothetical protein
MLRTQDCMLYPLCALLGFGTRAYGCTLRRSCDHTPPMMTRLSDYYVMDHRASSDRARSVRNRYAATLSAIPPPHHVSSHWLRRVHQRMLGRQTHDPSTHPYLRRIRSLQARCLAPDQLPSRHLSDAHVVYAVFCISSRRGLRTSRIYVGETGTGVIARFQRHIGLCSKIMRAALHDQDHPNPMHFFMARHDWRTFRIVPLERIRTHGLSAPALKAEREKRERFWTVLLHAFVPHGFNVKGKDMRFRATAGLPYVQPVPLPAASQHVVQPMAQPPSPHLPPGEHLALPPPDQLLAPPEGHPPHPPAGPVPVAAPHPRVFGYRDYARRVRFLSMFSASPLFRLDFLDRYLRVNLHRMLLCLRHNSHQDLHISLSDHARLSSMLSTYLGVERHRTAATCPPLISLYNTRAWDLVKVQNLLRDDSITSLLPQAVRTIIGRKGDPLAVWKYGKTLGQIVFNYPSLGRWLPDEALEIIETTPCACSSPAFAPYVHPSCGHVLTTDMSIVRDPHLRALLEKGTKFRPDVPDVDLPTHIDPSDPVGAMMFVFQQGLKSFVATMEKRFSIGAFQFHAWSAGVLHALGNRLAWLHEHSAAFRAQAASMDRQGTHPTHHSSFTKADSKTVRKLQQHFVFTFVDKGANNFAVMCKKHYMHILKSALATPTYSLSHESSSQIAERHAAWLATHGAQHPSPPGQTRADEPPPPLPVPYFYASIKFHKEPPSVRFIAGARGSTLEALSLWLTSAYRVLLPEADSLWSHTYQRANIHCPSSWILTRSEDLLPVLHTVNSSIPRASRAGAGLKFSTFDFSTLYTTLPLDELVQRMTQLHNRLFQHHHDNHPGELFLNLSWHKGESKWTADRGTDTKDKKYVTADILSTWLAYLVQNTYVTHGSEVYKQDIGIPMGTNCAVFVANLFLYTYELDHVTALVQRVEDNVDVDDALSLLKHHRWVKRFVDDLFAAGHPQFASLIPTIYPPSLTVTLSADAPAVDYLDMHISLTSKQYWGVDIFDKRRQAKFAHLHLLKYPPIDSVLGASAKYGVLTSQFHRFRRLCTQMGNFVSELTLLLTTLVDKGYSRTRLLSRLRALLYAAEGLFGVGSGALFTAVRRQVLLD